MGGAGVGDCLRLGDYFHCAEDGDGVYWSMDVYGDALFAGGASAVGYGADIGAAILCQELAVGGSLFFLAGGYSGDRLYDAAGCFAVHLCL